MNKERCSICNKMMGNSSHKNEKGEPTHVHCALNKPTKKEIMDEIWEIEQKTFDDVQELVEETLSKRADRFQILFNPSRAKVTVIDWHTNKARVYEW